MIARTPAVSKRPSTRLSLSSQSAVGPRREQSAARPGNLQRAQREGASPGSASLAGDCNLAGDGLERTVSGKPLRMVKVPGGVGVAADNDAEAGAYADAYADTYAYTYADPAAAGRSSPVPNGSPPRRRAGAGAVGPAAVGAIALRPPLASCGTILIKREDLPNELSPLRRRREFGGFSGESEGGSAEGQPLAARLLRTTQSAPVDFKAGGAEGAHASVADGGTPRRSSTQLVGQARRMSLEARVVADKGAASLERLQVSKKVSKCVRK